MTCEDQYDSLPDAPSAFFVMTNALAYNEWSASHAIGGAKTTLAYLGYCYGLGASACGRVDLEWGSLQVRGLGSVHAWDSWEGLGRFQSELTEDVDAVDTRARVLLQVGAVPPRLPLRAFVSMEGVHRWGRVEEARTISQEVRTSAGGSVLI